jgi:hypothetical protein
VTRPKKTVGTQTLTDLSEQSNFESHEFDDYAQPTQFSDSPDLSFSHPQSTNVGGGETLTLWTNPDDDLMQLTQPYDPSDFGYCHTEQPHCADCYEQQLNTSGNHPSFDGSWVYSQFSISGTSKWSIAT